MGTRTPSLRVKRPGREADHSPPSSAEVKECVELYLHYSSTLLLRGAQLKKTTGTTVPLLHHRVQRSRMRGAIPPLPQYAFMVWCSVKKKAQGQLYLCTLTLLVHVAISLAININLSF
jgi:hypothetical protein